MQNSENYNENFIFKNLDIKFKDLNFQCKNDP